MNFREPVGEGVPEYKHSSLCRLRNYFGVELMTTCNKKKRNGFTVAERSNLRLFNKLNRMTSIWSALQVFSYF